MAVALACATFTGSSQPEPSHETTSASEHPTLVQGRQVAEWVQAVTIGSLIPSPACAVLDSVGAQVMPQLTRLLLEDPSPEMRAKAAIAIGYIAWHNHSAPEVHNALPALTTAAQDTNADVRLYSVQALAAIGRAAGSAIPVLINLTSDQDDGVRMSAVEALGRVHAATPEPAVAALKMALLDRNSGVRATATGALEIVQSGHIRSFTSPPGQFSPNPARAANGSAANGLSSSG